MTIPDDSRYAPLDAPHWTRSARTKKRLCHLSINRQRACDGRFTQHRDYLRSADLDPSMPCCEVCFNRWIARHNAETWRRNAAKSAP